MSKRLNFCTCVVGFQGTGKSTEMRKLAETVAKSGDKKTLIIDVNNSAAYKDIQLLNYAKFQYWMENQEGGIKKFYDPDKDKMFNFLITKFYNGVLVFEDATKYIDARPKMNVRSYLTDHRMSNLDIFFMFHSIELIPPFFLKMTNYLTIFKTDDVIQENWNFYKKRFGHKHAERILACWNNVIASKNPYYNETILIRNN